MTHAGSSSRVSPGRPCRGKGAPPNGEFAFVPFHLFRSTSLRDDDAGNARNNLEDNATRVGTDAGECMVYVPEDSNMADPFGDGIPVGANIVDLLVDGVATGQALWSADGSFPCNVDPIDPPQVPSEQCADLAPRVGFSMTCDAPPSSG